MATVESLGTMSLEDKNSALDMPLEDDHATDVCPLCENKFSCPKILNCLHEFCEDCLKKKMETDKAEESSPSSPLAKEWLNDTSIQCPTCSQVTRLGEKGIAGLLSDTVLEDMIESDTNDKKQVVVTFSKFMIEHNRL